jgi:D-galactarolactone cycloisomerase
VHAQAVVERGLAQGVMVFKLMIGAQWEQGVSALASLRDRHGDSIALMADSNQAHDLAMAIDAGQALQPLQLQWWEEPLEADVPWPQWLTQRDECPGLSLAAGENIRSLPAFEQAIVSGALDVIQPDIIKWGSISGVREVIALARKAGIRYCPIIWAAPWAGRRQGNCCHTPMLSLRSRVAQRWLARNRCAIQ